MYLSGYVWLLVYGFAPVFVSVVDCRADRKRWPLHCYFCVTFQTCWSRVLSPGRTAGGFCMSPVLFRLYMWLFSCPVSGHSLVYLRHPRRPGSGFMRGKFEVCIVRIYMFSRCVRLQATLRESQAS